MYQVVDFIKQLTEEEERLKKMIVLCQQLWEELALVKQKHKKTLDEYTPAYEEMQRMQGEFNKRWNPRLAMYNKETEAIITKYTLMAKSA